MAAEKIGGKTPVNILIKDSADIIPALIGNPVPQDVNMMRISKLISNRYGGKYSLNINVQKDFNKLLNDVSQPYDIVVMSVLPEIMEMSKTGNYFDITDKYQNVIKTLKERNTHIIFFNVSSVVPGDNTYNYFRTTKSITSDIAKCNFALFNFSIYEGISIVDVDRLIAEMGAGKNTFGCGLYSDASNEAIAEEFMRIVEDIGFFEARPLMKQIGRRR